ncbi:hypothetical protein F2P56_001980 [Juglans regia]|uniref:Uncharacterized protein LOC108986632 n=2 Tax=Juglans regia TaxID=51240 RepID=A0A2I4E634_JUGRE|nr:uncharacterized protein LOC108986632 [Juglans regia]KAF5481319.1 hypothetical protein F2P56_001980 [Juglans regia]
MAPLKSPGPDGFGACFYQNHWGIIGDDVCAVVLDHLNGNTPFQPINFTYIALIPKKKDPKVVTEFRSISLCNIFYKIVSKVLVNRFKGVLSEIISGNQSAFIPGRIITDNIMLAYEVLHTMKVGKKGKKGNMAIKLDMSKAYDRIEWPFVKAVMKKLGFCLEWTELVIRCITSVSYSVLVNGKPGAKILHSRDLRQGDPLSPYLFIMCVEGLSSLLNHSDSIRITKGVTVVRGGLRVNHLLFVDDCILFGRASVEEWRSLQYLLLRNTSITEASLGNAPSLIWRSVWCSLGLLNEGLRRKVGNGAEISIWGQKWLQIPSTFCVQSPISRLDADARVIKLIDDDSKEWNEGLIRSVFIKEEAEHICNIPTSSRGVEDKLLWGPSREEVYLVKSAYFLEENIKKAVMGESSRESELDSRWKTIWDMKVPGKVEIFMWKAGNNLLATRGNLFSKKVIDNPLCPICLRGDETMMHVLWHCPATRDVWAESLRASQKWCVNEAGLLKLWEDLSGKLDKNELEEVAFIMRGVWMRMNKFIFENEFSILSSVIRTTKELLEDFHSVEEGTDVTGMPNNQTSTVVPKYWLPPGENNFKAN